MTSRDPIAFKMCIQEFVKRITFFGAIILAVNFSLFAQVEYPLSRNDSANIAEYSEQFQEHFKLGKKKEASRFLNLTAMLYWEKNHFAEAEIYFLKSLKINKELSNQNGIAMLHNNLAMICADKKDYTKALDYFDKTLVARRVSHEKIGIISALINQSVVLNKLKRYDEAIKSLKEALDLAREMNDPNQMKSCYGMLAETYEKAGDTKQSMYFYDYFKTFNDIVTKKKIKKSRIELDNERLKRELSEIKLKQKEVELNTTQRKLETSEHEVEVMSEQQKVLMETLSKKEMSFRIIKQESEIEHLENLNLKSEKKIQNTIIIFISIGLLIFLCFSILLFVMFKQKQKLNNVLVAKNQQIQLQNERISEAKRIIEIKNRSIEDSIKYAQHIQTSMLNRTEDLSTILRESFVFYQPRDVVSGDFYWYHEMNNKVFIVVADCTGHGVPGAFITMVGNNLISEAIEKDQIDDPAKILQFIDEGIIKTFNQNSTQNQDGMDASVVVIDKSDKILRYAGANSPMILITDGELDYIKPDKYGLGGIHSGAKSDRKKFETQEFDISDKDISFYLYSDGVVDQFDHSNEQKFYRSRLKRELARMHVNSMSEQLEEYTEMFNNWKGETHQTDDVTLFGGKVKL